MIEKHELIPKTENDSKVEIYLNNPAATIQDTGTEINLLNVFTNMKKARNLFIWLIIVCMFTGLFVPYVIGLNRYSAENVSAVITFQYSGVGELKAPDGSELDAGFIKSSYIVSDALKKTRLSKSVSLNSISQNISISRMLSDDTQKMMEILEKVDSATLNTNDPSKYIDAVNGVDYTYRNQYIITLRNGFSTGGANSKLIYLEGSELANLLNNIVQVYKEYFYSAYDNFRLPDNTIEDIRLDELDYIEWLDNINTLIDSLSDYCTDQSKGRFLNYRSEANGLSFTDINKMLKIFKSVRVDYLYSYIYYNYIAKNKDNLVTQFKYNLRSLTHNLDVLNENISSGSQLIENYKNNDILLNRQSKTDGEASDLTTKSVTDYYNSLIMKQSSLYSQKAALLIKIDNLQDKINGFSRYTASSASLAAIDEEVKSVNELCRSIYYLVRNLAEEISTSETYKNSFITSIDASYYGGFLSSNMKNILLGGVAGLFAGLVFWLVYGFVREVKESDRKAKAQKNDIS